MSIYGVIILAALLTGYLLNLVAESLNVSALRAQLPEAMRGVWDASAYAKSQAYTRARSRFGLLKEAFELTALLAFWFAGGFNWLDRLVSGWAAGAIIRGLFFALVLLLLRILVTLPFSIYDTFVIEERFGFNRTTAGTFFTDRLKGLGLAVALGGPLLAAVLALFEHAGSAAWIYCWLAVTSFTLFVQFIAPSWLMPLFNTFTPLEEGELRERIFSLAGSVSFPLENVFVIDGSRRSSKSNAFFTGFGRHKRIALFDTLVAQQTTEELLAVLAHEIGHYKKRHIIKGMVLSTVHTGVMLLLLSLFLGRQGLYDAFFMEQSPLYAGLIFAALLLAPLDMILSPVAHAISRRHEREADRFAVEATGSPSSLAAALRKLSVKNLSNLTPHPFYVFLHYSHPPLLARIEALESGGP